MQAEKLIQMLKKRGFHMATAESCTGGLLAAELIGVPGASKVIEEGYITYSDRVKTKVLGVGARTLEAYTAVSEEVAREMAEGLSKLTGAELTLSVTGYAGPDAGEDGTPAGTVYIGCQVQGDTVVQRFQFTGERNQVRRQSAEAAIDLAVCCLASVRKKILVIGGGPAGMMAALAAAKEGNEVLLYEKNEKLGKKLYITGKGRCNLTNHCDPEAFLSHVARNPKFLYSAIYTFSPGQVMDFFKAAGLSVKTERGNRVFPVSDKSSDVIKTLQQALEQRGVRWYLHQEVQGVSIEEGRCTGILLEGKKRVPADAVIVATGGISYASTGSTGDGYRFAKEAGLALQKTSPSLVPFETREDYITRLQGVSLKNVKLTLYSGQKKIYEEQGELLFTHFGVSGPLVLTASTKVSGKEVGGIRGEIDLKPALSCETLDTRLLREFQAASNHFFKNSLSRLLPAKMIPEVVALSGIDPEKRVHEVTKEERKRLLELLKAFPFTIERLRGYDEAIITRGGVSVREIDPGTMEAKKVKALYFAGEVLDLDAETGGYNLQIAWATGYLAGMAAGEEEEKDV